MKTSFNRIVVAAAVLAGFSLWPSRAQADTIDFLGTGRGTSVSIGGIYRTGTFFAGELHWQWYNQATPEDWAQNFYSYCVDVSQNLRDPQTVTRQTTDGFTNGAVDGGAKAAWLVNEYALGIRSNTNTTQANIQAAALQVAIWEAMYDSSASLSGGNFVLTGSSLTSAVRSQADIYLNWLYGDTSSEYNTSTARLLDARYGQDQILSSVSEPSTLLLMGVAFLAFASRARRQASSTPQQ